MQGQFIIQRRFRQLWESQDRWQLISHKNSVADGVVGIAKILAPTMGDGRSLSPDDYRVAKLNKRGKVVETYDAHGTQTDGFLVKPDPRWAGERRAGRVPVRRKTPVTA